MTGSLKPLQQGYRVGVARLHKLSAINVNISKFAPRMSLPGRKSRRSACPTNVIIFWCLDDMKTVVLVSALAFPTSERKKRRWKEWENARILLSGLPTVIPHALAGCNLIRFHILLLHSKVGKAVIWYRYVNPTRPKGTLLSQVPGTSPRTRPHPRVTFPACNPVLADVQHPEQQPSWVHRPGTSESDQRKARATCVVRSLHVGKVVMEHTSAPSLGSKHHGVKSRCNVLSCYRK